MKLKQDDLYLYFLLSLFSVKLISSTIIIYFIDIPFEIIYYILSLSFFAIVVFFETREKTGLSISLSLFLVVCLLSLLLNDIDPIFQSEKRFSFFVIMMIIIGPLLVNKRLNLVRKKVFLIILNILQVCILVSFVYKLLGIEQLGRGHFGGVFSHSMILAPISALVLIKACHCVLVKPNKCFYILLTIASLTCLFYSGSRVAFAGGMLAVFMYIVFTPIRFKFMCLSFALLLSVGYLALADVAVSSGKGLTQDRGNTRSELWDSRIKEFKLSPYYGAGFSSVIYQKEKNKFTENNGAIEPGSSYLAILSMTGILGFILFLTILLRYLSISSILKPYKSDSDLSTFFLLFFLVHFSGEGYVIAAGSLMFFMFWLNLSSSHE